MSNYHKSVLLHEVLENLQITKNNQYIDGTLGGGGHTLEIVKSGGKVLGIDVDQDALDFVSQSIGQQTHVTNRLTLVRGNFRNIDDLARTNGFDQVAGILLDLGVSSHQLDTAERGFSFIHEALLDMRMDKTLQVSAKDLLNVLTKKELEQLFTEFGEERFSKRIATNIVESRKVKPIETTKDLEMLIKRNVPHLDHKTNPATRVFQALRIAVNDEIGSLQEVLPKALELLKQNGRLAIITFHSLEDRMVKHTFIDWEKQRKGMIITKKPVEPTEEEITENPRSRSAKLRVFEKLG